MFGYQRNGFCCGVKRSVLRLGLWVHKQFLSITCRRCMTASATPYAKDFLSPIFGYRDCCFVIVISLMMIFLMECSTTPILVKGLLRFIRKISIVGFPRIILFGVKWLVENGVLVRQLFCVNQKLRPFLYHPSVNFSWETIRELLQLHHFFQSSYIRGRFFSLYPTIERECEPKCKIGISLISEFIQSSKSFPMKLRNALVC